MSTPISSISRLISISVSIFISTATSYTSVSLYPLSMSSLSPYLIIYFYIHIYTCVTCLCVLYPQHGLRYLYLDGQRLPYDRTAGRRLLSRVDERGGRLLRRDDEGPLRVDKGPSGLGRICDSWDVEAQQEGPLQDPGGWGTGWTRAGHRHQD